MLFKQNTETVVYIQNCIFGGATQVTILYHFIYEYDTVVDYNKCKEIHKSTRRLVKFGQKLKSISAINSRKIHDSKSLNMFYGKQDKVNLIVKSITRIFCLYLF